MSAVAPTQSAPFKIPRAASSPLRTHSPAEVMRLRYGSSREPRCGVFRARARILSVVLGRRQPTLSSTCCHRRWRLGNGCSPSRSAGGEGSSGIVRDPFEDVLARAIGAREHDEHTSKAVLSTRADPGALEIFVKTAKGL
jgi:hypothetical protein